jgi:hypothetical protein
MHLQSQTDKINKKSKLLVMYPLTIGIDRDPLKELPGQFSAHPIKPFSFKLPFKESVPQNIGQTLEKIDKIMKNSAITFFFEKWNDPKGWWTFHELLSPKRIPKFHCPRTINYSLYV